MSVSLFIAPYIYNTYGMQPAKFGAEIGRPWAHIGGGVAFRSSHYDSADSDDEARGYSLSYRLGHNAPDSPLLHGIGYAYQCVGSVRTALLHLYDTTFPSIPMAYHIFSLPYFEQLHPVPGERGKIVAERVPTLRCENGKAPEGASKDLIARPPPGSLLIWDPMGWFRWTGHVAIVVDVVPRSDDGRRWGVRVAESNTYDAVWDNEDKSFARELPARITDEGHFHIDEPHPEGGRIKGWICSTNIFEHEHPNSPTFVATTAQYRAARRAQIFASNARLAAVENDDDDEDSDGGDGEEAEEENGSSNGSNSGRGDDAA